MGRLGQRAPFNVKSVPTGSAPAGVGCPSNAARVIDFCREAPLTFRVRLARPITSGRPFLRLSQYPSLHMANRRWNPGPVVFMWTLLALGLTGLCAIPTVSARWQRGFALQDTGGSERAGVVHAPMSATFVSFVTLRVYGDQPTSAIEMRLQGDGDPQPPLKVRLEKDGQGAYSTTITPPRLFTRGAIRLHVLGDLNASLRIGNDQKRPVRSPLRLWWPWLLIVYVSGTAILLHPSTAHAQALLTATVRKAVRIPSAMLLLLLSAAGIRTFLVLRGGQYFDLDEGRYTQVAHVLELLGREI